MREAAAARALALIERQLAAALDRNPGFEGDVLLLAADALEESAQAMLGLSDAAVAPCLRTHAARLARQMVRLRDRCRALAPCVAEIGEHRGSDAAAPHHHESLTGEPA